MAKQLAPSLSLIVSLAPRAKSGELLPLILDWIERQSGMAITLRLPAAMLEEDPSGPEWSAENSPADLGRRLTQLKQGRSLDLIFDGYSGVAEGELSPFLLELERTNAERIAIGLSQDAVVMPETVDPARPAAHIEVHARLRGWTRIADSPAGVFFTRDGLCALPFLKDPARLNPGRRLKDIQRELHKIRASVPESALGLIWRVEEQEDIQRLDELVDELSPVFEDPKAPQWISFAKALSTAIRGDFPGLEPSDREPGSGELPCRTAMIIRLGDSLSLHSGKRRAMGYLSALAQGCSDEDLPHKIGETPPERELVASMLGSASMHGESMELQFNDGVLHQINADFGRSLGYRVPGMEIENRNLYWNIESAFSFDTDDTRGLRQIATLTSDLFTLSGRAVTDYYFQDGIPALIIDIRIQHPWIEKSLQIDRYLPWSIGVWDLPLGESAELFRGMSRNESFPAGLEEKLKVQEPKRGLGLRPQRKEMRVSVPGTFWDYSTAKGRLRIRRGESLLGSELPQPALLVLSPHKTGTSLSLCPTRHYAGLHSWQLKGLNEHFALLAYDPKKEEELQVALTRQIRDKVLRPWMLRS